MSIAAIPDDPPDVSIAVEWKLNADVDPRYATHLRISVDAHDAS